MRQKNTETGSRLALPQVTLCAASSVNVAATIRALEVCLAQIDFAACKLFTDASVQPSHPAIEKVAIEQLTSSAAYSDFVLTRMVDHVATSHCLLVQWDGHVLNAGRWRPEFLDYDYIGASWPQFHDGHDVGNGGFSLRSRQLMEACRDPEFLNGDVEDLVICRTNRDWLESKGMRFAPRSLADMFSAERASDPATSFGYHGVFLMPQAIGVKAFWQIYLELDDLGTVRHDFWDMVRNMGAGRAGLSRAARMSVDRLKYVLRGARR